MLTFNSSYLLSVAQDEVHMNLNMIYVLAKNWIKPTIGSYVRIKWQAWFRSIFLLIDGVSSAVIYIHMKISRAKTSLLQMFAKHAANVLYQPGATKPSFFIQQWSKKCPFSLTLCKMWWAPANLQKMMSSISLKSISRKASTKVP
jgi:hypothetical protein